MGSRHGGSASIKHPSGAEKGATVVHFDESLRNSNSGKSELSEETRETSENASDVTHSRTENSKSFNSVRSSTSECSSDDFFEVDPIIIPSSEPTGHNVPPKSEANTASQVEDRTDHLYSGPLIELEDVFSSSRSFSQFSVTHEPSATTSSTKSPPTQVMERPKGHDSGHIPASVFIRPSSTPVDWSIVSNDSLFSIPIGSCRLSRDQALRTGGETHEHKDTGISGELDYSIEWYRAGEQKSSSDLISFKQHNPVAKGGDHIGKGQLFQKPKEKLHKKTTRDQDEAYSRTDEHQKDDLSCPFPRKNSSRRSHLCADCSCPFCSRKQPSCSSCCSKRPCFSCSCLTQPGCSGKSMCMPSYCCK